MNAPQLSHFEASLLHMLGEIVKSNDRVARAVANGAKPMLTDEEAADRLGFNGEHPDKYMQRLGQSGAFRSTLAGRYRLWSAEDIDKKIITCHRSELPFTPTAMKREDEPEPTRKPREDVAA